MKSIYTAAMIVSMLLAPTTVWAQDSTNRNISPTYTLTVTAANGTVIKSPYKTSFSSGETVILTAVPNAGYAFSGWSGSATGKTNPVTITMNSNKSVTATFVATTLIDIGDDTAGSAPKAVCAETNNADPNTDHSSTTVRDHRIVWEENYSIAIKKAERTHKPLMVMMTAEWCGPCRMMNENTFTDPLINKILKPFVVVRAYEDKIAEAKYGLNGYPTIVFLDANQKVVHRITGYLTPGPFFKEVMNAYELCGIEIPEAWKELVSKVAKPDWDVALHLAEQGKVEELQKMLKVIENDPLSDIHILIAQIEGKDYTDENPLDVFWGYSYKTVPDSNVLLLFTRDKTEYINITYPGYEQIIDPLSFYNSKVLTKTYKLKRLSKESAYSLRGNVLLPDGKPAIGAIVRVYDWTTVKTDQQGYFEITPISKGDFTVRAEYSGCDVEKEVKIDSAAKEKIELLLKPAPTMHFRFTYQNIPEMTSFTEGNLSHGEAIISKGSSRFSLRRQHPLGNWGSDFMLDLKDGQLVFWLFDSTG